MEGVRGNPTKVWGKDICSRLGGGVTQSRSGGRVFPNITLALLVL